MQNKEQLRARRRELHEVLLDHDHRDSGEDGCLCAGVYAEINEIWHVLNDGKPQHTPRAGPRPPYTGDDDHPSVDLENWLYLKATEPDEEQ